MKQTSTTQSTRGRKPGSQNAGGNKTNKNGSRQSATREGNNQKGNTTSSSRSTTSSRAGSSKSASSREASEMRSRGRESSHRSAHEAGSFEGASHLEKFFLDQLHDIYYAEQKITQSLPKMQEAATTEELKEAFEDHLHQTQRHVRRLEKVFETLGRKAEGKKCEAIEGISREVESIIAETEEGSMTRDAALIIAGQKVEHYEIATYGGLVQLAITMQLHEAADLLDKTLVEEEDTDARLTEIAENSINLRAEHEGGQDAWSQGERDEDEDKAGSSEASGDEEEPA
jgi:ferritin-like metal-binding protein YciE